MKKQILFDYHLGVSPLQTDSVCPLLTKSSWVGVSSLALYSQLVDAVYNVTSYSMCIYLTFSPYLASGVVSTVFM